MGFVLDLSKPLPDPTWETLPGLEQPVLVFTAEQVGSSVLPEYAYHNTCTPFCVRKQNGEQATFWVRIDSLKVATGSSEEKIRTFGRWQNWTGLLEAAQIDRTYSQLATKEALSNPLNPLFYQACNAVLNGRPAIRLSKQISQLAATLTIFAQQERPLVFGDLKGALVGHGGYAKVKKAHFFYHGTVVARRVCTDLAYFSPLLEAQSLSDIEGVLPNFGVIPYSSYKKGRPQYLSFHPLCDFDLRSVSFYPDRKLEFQSKFAVHVLNLFRTMKTFSERGVHGDLTLSNVLKKGDSLFVSDFDFFHPLGMIITEERRWEPCGRTPPEGVPKNWIPDPKSDVWQLAFGLLALALPGDGFIIDYFPWFRKDTLPTREEFATVASQIETLKDPRLKVLFGGMLQLDPENRWTFQQAYDYAAANFPTSPLIFNPP